MPNCVFLTGDCPAKVPGTPEHLYVVDNSGGKVTLTWSVPDNDDGRVSVTRWIVYYGPASEPNHLLSRLNVDGGSTSCTLQITESGSNFKFAIAGENSFGVGEMSCFIFSKVSCYILPFKDCI
jgi:Fibronectin type III domain